MRLVFLEQATIVRAGGAIVLRDFNWTIQEGETWAIVGPIGSGKTTLAEVLLGKHHLETGAIGWPFLDRLRAAGRAISWPSDVIQLVAFKEDSWLFNYSRHYYQQRFNFIEPQDDLTLDAFLRAGTAATDAALATAAGQLGIENLLPLSLIKLSNGQMRRARIARALLARPALLILDDPFLGLDVAGRGEVAVLLGDLIRQGLHVVLITRPDAVPDWVTNVLELPPRTGSLACPAGERTGKVACPTEQRDGGEAIVELRNVNIAYGERAILRDVSWTVRAGERWAVLGPNGSGKSTLLSLLCGDHPQAYANDIWLFGRKRGTGESIWEIKHNIGLVSPELRLYFTEPLSASEAASTGFFDVLVPRPTTREQDVTVQGLFDHFGIQPLMDRLFARLSTGEQRLVLLIRALVKAPPLLILDEPFQGLDTRMIQLLREWLEVRLRPEQTLLLVSHHAEEVPRTVTRLLRLEQGRVVETC